MEKPRVLVADSNSEFRSQCVQSLRRQDIEVVAEAADGQEAFQKIARVKPNVVISDLYLGKIDGVGLIRSTKMQMPEEFPSFIMLASFASDKYHGRSRWSSSARRVKRRRLSFRFQ